MATLDDVVAGDQVFIYQHRYTYGEYRIHRVTKATKTQLVVNGGRFNRRNGRLVGADSWSTMRVEIFDAAKWEVIRPVQEIRDMKMFVSEFPWNKCSDDLLRKVYALLNPPLSSSTSPELMTDKK